SRALGFSSRTIEEFGQRGLLHRFGQVHTIPIGHFGGLQLDYRVLDAGSFGARWKPQLFTEAVLAKWATGLGAEVRRGTELTGFGQDADGVTVELATPDGPRRLRARYLAGCDGARSTVRKLAGIDFPGTSKRIDMWFADIGLPAAAAHLRRGSAERQRDGAGDGPGHAPRHHVRPRRDAAAGRGRAGVRRRGRHLAAADRRGHSRREAAVDQLRHRRQ